MTQTAPDSPAADEKLPFLPRKKKFLIPIAILLSIVVFGLAGGLLYAFVSLKQTEPYKATMRTLQEHGEVRQHVGVPFEAGFIVLGEVKDDTGVADLIFHIKGPAGKAAVRSRVQRIDGAWVVTYLDMGIGGRDGTVITMIGDPDELPQ